MATSRKRIREPAEEDLRVKPHMIEPMAGSMRDGYVPLSAAILWIMTDGGAAVRSLDDDRAWTSSAERLLSLMSTGQVEAIGRPIEGGSPRVIPGSIFARIAIGFPLRDVTEMLVGDDPWIGPHIYLDEEHWTRGFNDQLFERRASPASWTHLQVRKADVLTSFGSLVEPTFHSAKDRPISNLSGKGKMKRAIAAAVDELFPDGIPPGMSSQTRNDRIRAKIKETPGVDALPTDRTIQKCLKDLKPR